MVQGSFRTQACFWSGLIRRVCDWLRKLAPLFLTNQLLEKRKKKLLASTRISALAYARGFRSFLHNSAQRVFGGYVIQKSCMRTCFCQ